MHAKRRPRRASGPEATLCHVLHLLGRLTRLTGAATVRETKLSCTRNARRKKASRARRNGWGGPPARLLHRVRRPSNPGRRWWCAVAVLGLAPRKFLEVVFPRCAGVSRVGRTVLVDLDEAERVVRGLSASAGGALGFRTTQGHDATHGGSLVWAPGLVHSHPATGKGTKTESAPQRPVPRPTCIGEPLAGGSAKDR